MMLDPALDFFDGKARLDPNFTYEVSALALLNFKERRGEILDTLPRGDHPSVNFVSTSLPLHSTLGPRLSWWTTGPPMEPQRSF